MPVAVVGQLQVVTRLVRNMKVKTNLSSDELNLVSKGLSRLAAKQQEDGKFVPNNSAEKDLIAQATDSLEEMLLSLKYQVSEMFKGE